MSKSSGRNKSSGADKNTRLIGPLRPATLSVGDKAIGELSTLRDCLRYAVSRFGQADIFCGHGMADAHDEAVYLIQWALHLPPERLDPYLDAALSRAERSAIIALIDARCQRIPAAYLTGRAWLAGVEFLCDRRALIPRSLIAESMSGSLADWIAEPPARVLDLCTGGGSLAILAALHWPQCSVLAADIAPQALQLATENIALHRLQERVAVRRSDLLDDVLPDRFDLILCNPPYVNADSMSRLPAEFLAEPRGALAGGSDGMDLVRRILGQAGAALNPGGALLLEIGHEAAHFERAFPTIEFSYLPVTQGEQMLVWVTRDQLQAAALSPAPMLSSVPSPASAKPSAKPSSKPSSKSSSKPSSKSSSKSPARARKSAERSGRDRPE